MDQPDHSIPLPGARVRAMVPRVERIDLGQPRRLLNDTLQRISELPARFKAAAS